MGRGNAANERTIPASAQGVSLPEGSSAVTARGRGDGAAGEVFDHGTHQEDDPVTWETLAFPRDDTVLRGAVSEISDGRHVLRVHVAAGEEEDTRSEVGRRQGEPEPRPRDDRES